MFIANDAIGGASIEDGGKSHIWSFLLFVEAADGAHALMRG
jgi:hypothetical protein